MNEKKNLLYNISFCLHWKDPKAVTEEPSSDAESLDDNSNSNSKQNYDEPIEEINPDYYTDDGSKSTVQTTIPPTTEESTIGLVKCSNGYFRTTINTCAGKKNNCLLNILKF